MKKCIVHPRFVTAEFFNPNNTQAERNRAFAAGFDIEQVLRDDPYAFIIETGDPALVAEHFKQGDNVILYGAYLGGCLKTAFEALQAIGAKPEYHSTGCIPFFEGK